MLESLKITKSKLGKHFPSTLEAVCLIVLRILFCIWSTKNGFMDWRFWLAWSFTGQEWFGTGPFQVAAQTSGCPVINYICLGSGGNSASNKPWRNCCCKEYKLELLKGARCSNGTDARISGLLVRFCVWPGGGGAQWNAGLQTGVKRAVCGRESKLSLNKCHGIPAASRELPGDDVMLRCQIEISTGGETDGLEPV